MDIKKTFKDFVNEANLNEGKFDGIADLVKALHFETDSKTAEEMKMAIGKSQGEFNKKKQIEGGEYSLRRFRKEIKFGDGTYLGVFLPGSYDAATSVLGDGPHKKAVKKVKWNQKKYDQWLEDSASNGGADNAFDMAQNAKNEIGLIDWVKKEFRGDDPLQRIQWDIEGYAESIEVYESVTTEGKYYGMIAGDAASDIAKELSFYVKKIIKQSNGKVTYFHVKDQPSVNKTMYSLRDLYGIESQSGDRKFSPYKTVKFDNDQIISETVTENRELIKIDSYLNTKDERVLIDFCDDAYGNSDDRKTKKEWNDARNDLSYNELVDYAVAHAENFGMDLQDIEDAIEVYESVVTEAKFDKKKLMKAMKHDDGMIQLGNGQEYVIYNPNNGNDDNTDMWKDKVIFALDQDGEEHEIEYSDIVSYNESIITEAKDMTFADYLEVLDVKFEDAMAAVKGENGSDAEIKPTRGDILQNFTLFRNYVSSLTKKYKGDKTRLRFLKECVNEYNGIINESVVTEEVTYNSSNTKPEAAKKATKEFGKLLPKANKGVEPYVFAVVKTKARNYRLAIKSGSYVAHEFMSGLKEDGILTADIVKKAVANVIKLNPEEFNESVVTEAKNTIGLAFKEEQDYLDFKEFVAEQPRGAIRKNIGFDSKTKSWNVEMDVKVLDSIYGEGTPSDKKSGWYGGLPDDFESVIIEGAISKSRFETFLNEASRRKVHKAAKQGSYPAVIVVVQDGKVIHQEPVSTPDIAPATFNVMQEKYPKALLHLEDKTGKRLFSESIVNEARQAPAKTLFKMIVKGSASEIEGVKISSAMAQAALDWFDRSTYARKYEKQVKTAGMGAVAPLIFGDNWGIKKTIPSKLKAEFKELQAEYKRVMPENESVVTESLSIAGMASMLLGLGIAARIGFMSDEKYASMIGSIIPTAKAIVKSLPIIGDKVKNQELKDYQTKEVEKYLNGEISDKDIVAILNENPKLKKAIEDVATSGLNYKEYYKLIKEIGGAADKWGNTHRKFKQLRKKISDGKVLESLVTEGMSKSAIKKAIKTIDKQIDTETGGDGEPLDNETLQALEQERERLLAMNEGKIKNSKEIKELEELLKSIKSNTPAAQGRKASIQDDIERLKNESLVNEAKAYKLKASEFGGDTHSAAYNVKGETTWRVHSTYAIDQVSGENNPEERDVIFFEAMPINNDIYIKIGGINNLKRSNGSTVGENFGTTIEEWKKDPKGIAKEASEFLTDATHLKWINKKARSEGQVIKWALKDDYASVIEDLVNKSLGLNEAKTSKEKLEYLLWDLENSNKLSNPSDPKKKAALIKKLKKQLDTVKESLVVESSEEAYSLHRLGDNLGQEVAAEFLSKYDVDLKLLTKAVQQKTINKYEIRDVVNGSAHKLKVKTFIKDFVNESSITEAKLTRGLKPLLTIGSTINKKAGEDALLDLSDKFDRIDDEYAGTIASWLDMAIELMQDGYSGDATKKLKQFNKACKDVLNGKEVGSAFESTVNEAKGVNRAELTDYLEKHLKLVRTSEEFDGTEGGIWTSAENGEKFSGSQIFDYYSESSKYEFGVLNKFAKVLSKMGWYCEFYDPGTVMIWEE